MPKKRCLSASLTGGTGDVNPQYQSVQFLQISPDLNGTAILALPQNRLPNREGMVNVFEILQIEWDLSLIAPGTAGTYTTIAVLSTAPVISTGFGFPNNATDVRNMKMNPKVIDYIETTRVVLTGVGFVERDLAEPQSHTLHDGAGHGILIATDNLYLGVTTRGADVTTQAQTGTAHIMYRIKAVGLTEYIGIVQSQQ